MAHYGACSVALTLLLSTPLSLMQDTPKEQLLELARRAVEEQDLEKMLAMIERIEQLVEEEKAGLRLISH